jgi:ABC-type nickel/cobalt efflux system permease component RcnA
MLPITFGLLGVLLGMRHAFEPDHLAAVSTLVTEERGARRAAALGALWGVGHSAALLAVGLALALLGSEMPPRLADVFELGVAVMLVLLGIRGVRRALALGRTGSPTRHAHAGLVHEHQGPADHLHVGRWTFARRAFIVGVVHGLAGSGSLTALVVASLPTTGARIAYVALFGVGSIGGMAVLSGLAGLPLGRLARHPRAARAIIASTGVVSLAVGVAWGYPLALRLMS